MEHTATVSEDGADFDRGSVSTVATTASLSSRIASLAVDFAEKLRPGIAEEAEYEDAYQDNEEEVIELTEEEIMRELERQEPGLQVCARLFLPMEPDTISLKCLSFSDVMTFRQQGFLVLDNFISRDLAARMRNEALSQRSLTQDASSSSHMPAGDDHFTDHTARGDHILWLHPGRGPATMPGIAAVLTSLQDLQDDLREIMKLRLQQAEYQLAYYPPNGAQYVRHRDAFPDDGSEEHQRRVTAIVYANPGWHAADGGKLRIWIPHRTDSERYHSAPTSTAHFSMSPTGSQSDSASAHRSHASSHRHPFEGPSPVAHATHSGRHGAGFDSALQHMEAHAQEGHLANGHTHDGPLANGHAAHAGRHGQVLESALDHLDALRAQEGSAHLNGHPNGHVDLTRQLSGSVRRLSSDGGSACDHSDTASHRSDGMLAPVYGGASLASSIIVEANEASVPSSSHDASSVDEGAMPVNGLDRSWQGEQGVERLEVGTEAVVDVAPLPGRLVLMLAGAVEHAVLPNFSDRVALTAWCQ